MASKTRVSKHFVCGYCLNELSKQKFLTDEKKVYEKMATDTFNIQICHLTSKEKWICLKCAKGLRIASKLKQTVLEVQKTLLEQCGKLTGKECESSKQEIDSSGFEDFGCDDSSSVADDLDKDGDSEAIKIKLEPMEMPMNESLSLLKRRNIYVKRSSIKTEMSRGETKRLKKKTNVRRHDKDKPKTSSSEPKNQHASLTYMKRNSINLLINSNMCLFISKRTKYACYTCNDTFLDIRHLREHSTSHIVGNKIRNDLHRNRGLTLKNVDISNLACKICSQHCDDLIVLQDHLTNNHEVVFENAKNLLLPFKLEEGFKCVICQDTFSTFNALSIHMNSHSTSNVCETCGVAYTNRIGLRNHINATHKQKKCSKCPAVFPTSAAKTRHLRHAHNLGASKRHCMKCDMTFRYTYCLKNHMIEKHGEKRPIADCEHCSKRFPSTNALKVHIRGVHVGERNYPCSICDMRFFTSYDKARHERTHKDEKPFACSFCDVKFKSRDSERRHLKRQHGDSKASNS